MKIEDKGHIVIIYENLLDWYDEDTDSLFETSPLKFENGKLIEINEDFVAIEKEKGFSIYFMDGVGSKHQLLDSVMSTKEAAEMWGVDDSSIRKQISKFPIGTVRKFGKQWIVTREGMEKVFGVKNKEETNNE